MFSFSCIIFSDLLHNTVQNKTNPATSVSVGMFSEGEREKGREKSEGEKGRGWWNHPAAP